MSKKLYPIVVVTLLLLSGPLFLKANNYTAKATGNWTTAGTWSPAGVPTAADNVTIPNGWTVTVSTTTAVASTVTINTGGKLTIGNGDKITIGGNLTNAGTITTNKGSLIIGGSLTNSGSMTVSANGTLTFDGASNSTIISSSGTYSIPGTVVMNMGSAATALDVQDPNFISGINSGGKYYFTFTRGTFRMDNTGALNNAYNSGSTNTLTIPFGVTIEADNGTMNLASLGTTGNVLLSGKLFVNGGTVYVQTGQALNAGPADDFQYAVNGGTPQLYISSGSLTVGGGFSPKSGTSYIDFNMSGGTMTVTSREASNNATFQLQNVAGGKTAMSGGRIIIEEPGLGGNSDLDMGGSNISPYSVTGGTVQLGSSTMQSSAGYYAIQPYSTTNYPNIDMEPGFAETAAANASGNFNFLSLYINSKATFDASGAITGGSIMGNVNITGSNGVYAFDDEGTFTPGTSTFEFSGSVSQPITSAAVSPVSFYNLTVANTSGNVVLGVATHVTNQLAFTSGKLDASADPLTITNGARAITGMGNSSYVITGDGVTNTGYLAIQNLLANTTTTFPIGTSSYYLPATIKPVAAGTAYTAYVYPGVTTNAQANGTSVSAPVLSEMADVTWNVGRTAGAGSATLGLNWSSSGTTLEGANFQGYGTNIGITQYSGSWATATGTGNVATETASASFSSFSQFSVIGTPIILPLVLADFTAVPKGSTVALAWAAFPDGQPASFTIQRSADGLGWNNIDVVQADASATTETDYTYTDASPVTGENYYRLYIQNADGSSTYSSVRTVAFTAAAQVSAYPNPANTSLTISVGGSGKPLVFRLVNTAGTVLQSKIADAGISTLTMNTGSYPAGVYYLETLDGGQLVQTTAVMVVH
ncbi:MAG TPA: T9SS type A sorting domain-containing protein [Puia sp.]|nr:T9SS type A sorting domain-containing protein [Puia sp.]